MFSPEGGEVMGVRNERLALMLLSTVVAAIAGRDAGAVNGLISDCADQAERHHMEHPDCSWIRFQHISIVGGRRPRGPVPGQD